MFKRKFLNNWSNFKKIIILLFLLLLVFGGIKLFITASKNKLTPSVFWQFLTNKTDALKQINGRTNILLLGIGGKNHDGADLTDTIILLSINWQKKDLALISIPRDIWLPEFKDKINAAYQIGEKNKIGGGFIVTKAAVEEVVGIPVSYAYLIDFNGFKEVIDLIGGVEVNISATFTDNEYPISGRENDDCGGDLKYLCRYESVTFTKGIEHMDGERALKYVRSRHAEGDNGTDFARSDRQKVVIAAVKDKMIQEKIFLNPQKLLKLVQIAQKTTKTDLYLGEILLLGKRIAFDKQTIRSFSIAWDRPEKNELGLLVSPSIWQYNNLWVLVPKTGNYDQIHEYIKCEIDLEKNCEKIYK